MIKMYDEFLNIANNLNNELLIVPLLFGSLGLQKITNIDFSPNDIDILIPKKYINSDWEKFKIKIEFMGYKLIDLHEHTFIKDNIKIAFADIEGLEKFAGIDIEKINVVGDRDVSYKILNLEQYLKVYLQSSKDGYRNTKKNNKDMEKVEIIQQLLKGIKIKRL